MPHNIPTDELLKQLASRTAGREPAWQRLGPYTPSTLPGPPNADVVGAPDNQGVSVLHAILTPFRVLLRRNPASRLGEVGVTLFSHPSTYRVTVNGTNHDYVTLVTDGADDVLAGLAASINGGAEAGNVTAVVTATHNLLSGSGNILRIVGNSPTTFTSLASSVPAGAGTIESQVEAEAVDFRAWALWDNLFASGSTPFPEGRQFDLVNGASFFAANGENFTDFFETSGMARLFIEPTATDGTFTIFIGPGSLEVTAES